MSNLSEKKQGMHSPIGDLIASITANVARQSGLKAISSRVVSVESLNDSDLREMSSVGDNIRQFFNGESEASLESLKQLGANGKRGFSQAQIDAATQGAFIGSGWERFKKRAPLDAMPLGVNPSSVVTVESYGVSDAMATRSYANEAYNEADNRSAVAFTIAYNLMASRQDEFGEALYPTLTIPADEAGVSIAVNLMYVLDNVDRETSGDAYDTYRKNLLRAAEDPTILHKDQTLCVPVVRSQSLDKFVDASDIAATDVVLEDGTTISTAPLLFNKKIDLLGISQSDAMVAMGVQNQTDTLEPGAIVSYVYVKLGADILKLRTDGLPGSNFTPGVQGDYKNHTLNLDSTSVLLSGTVTQWDGSAVTEAPLVALATSGNRVRLHLVLSGTLRTDYGNITVYANTLEVSEISTEDGTTLASTDTVYAAMATLIDAATFMGYDQKSYRSNANRRQQGQFIDVATQYQRYVVPLRSPITARHPAHVDANVDATDVQALIAATRLRMGNEAVTSVLSAVDMLSTYVDVQDTAGEGPDVLGVGRFYVRPTYLYREWDATLKVDSKTSFERAQDISAALINELRDMAYRLYRDSQYKVAADMLNGDVGPVPTVIIATDPVTMRYLIVPGDLRTLGNEFNVKVVSTLDRRMKGKIVMAFGVFDGQQNTTINPLTNGNLFWAPELVLTANIGRGGTYNRETLVQPRYLFVNHLPVLGVMDVSNIPNVLNKVPLNVNDVTAAP